MATKADMPWEACSSPATALRAAVAAAFVMLTASTLGVTILSPLPLPCRLRIAAVFVILVASTLGVMLPALHKAIPWLHKDRTLFQVGRRLHLLPALEWCQGGRGGSEGWLPCSYPPAQGHTCKQELM